MMDYNHIDGFLEKFKKLLGKSEASYKVIADVMTNHIGMQITPSMIKVKGAIIYIQGSPMLRSEILVHKEGILRDVSNMLSERNFSDIR
jgi:hypothetical protein